MDDCVFVAIAGDSLIQNLSAISDGQAITAEDERCRDGHTLFEIWQHAEKRPHASPFAELAPLVNTTLGKHYRSLRVILLGHFDELDAGDALRDGTLQTYLQKMVGADPGDSRAIVECRDIGVTAVTDAAKLPQVQAAIMDHCAQIEIDARAGALKVVPNEASDAGAGSRHPQVVGNGVSGMNGAVEALVWSAGALGWKIAYENVGNDYWTTLRQPATSFGLHPKQIAQQWTQARSHVLAARKRFSAALSDQKGVVLTDFMVSAAGENLLPFVAVQKDSPGMDSPRQSRMGNLLNAEQSFRGPRFYSASARLLERFADNPPYGTTDDEKQLIADEVTEATKYAARLDELLARWETSQLFGSNLVREMVLHEESHCQTVDLNVSTLCEPLLDEGLLRPIDIFHLALAAWLHDWGHSGVVTSDLGQWRMITDPRDVRAVHGLLSKLRIKNMQGQSGLEDGERAWPALISAHHQGWTSIGDHSPTRPACLKAIGELQVNSLWKDIDELLVTAPAGAASRAPVADRIGHLAPGKMPVATAARAQLLAALFRIADAADVGLHRVPHRDPELLLVRLADEAGQYIQSQLNKPGMSQECADELTLYCSQQVDRTWWREEFDSIKLACVGDGGALAALAAAWKIAPEDAYRHIDYVCHCFQQREFFEVHARVANVHLMMDSDTRGFPDKRPSRWRLTAHVLPAASTKQEIALAAVRRDILRELGLSDTGQDGPPWPNDYHGDAKYKQVVRHVLEANGIRFDGVVAANTDA